MKVRCTSVERHEHQRLSGCSGDVASWIWGSGWPKGISVIHDTQESKIAFFFCDPASLKRNRESTGLDYFLNVNLPLAIASSLLHYLKTLRCLY